MNYDGVRHNTRTQTADDCDVSMLMRHTVDTGINDAMPLNASEIIDMELE